jgi:hypothetical protein
MVLECEALAAALQPMEVPFLGFCWYPYIDSTDWSSLVCEANRTIDPQGVYGLDAHFERRTSELSVLFADLVAGRVTAAELPAYGFSDEVLEIRMVRNFLPHMPWRWVEERDLSLTA